MSIGYVTIGALDVEAALPFWDGVLGAAGYARGPLERGAAFYGKDGAPSVGVCKPFDGQPAHGGNGIMIAFKADSQAAVQAAYDAALANGGTDEGAPGYRPPGATSGFFGAYVRDPTGNKVCVFTGV
jgi:catechol 2,3-dioxygenase-like lactoylglutathione lyase family enzyme